MAPVKRITPEVDFPETQGGAQVYGTAWPLSDKYYLCVYDPTMQPNAAWNGRITHRAPAIGHSGVLALPMQLLTQCCFWLLMSPLS